MDPHTGEILALANWPTFNPNAFNAVDPVDAAQPRHSGSLRARFDVQGRHRIGGDRGRADPHGRSDRLQSRLHHASGARVIRDTHEYGVLPFIDVIAKSSNVGAIKVGMKVGRRAAGALHQPLWLRPVARTGLPRRERGHGLEPGAARPSALASVSMGYQVGVTPLQMAAAVERRRQWRRTDRAARRPRVHPATAIARRLPRKVVRRAITPETAATLTDIMEAVVERGTAKIVRADVDGFTVAGKTGTASKLVNGALFEVRLQRVVCRIRPVAQAGGRRSWSSSIRRMRGGYYGAVVSAPVFKRIAEATLRHLGVGPTLNAPPPVIVAAP